MLNPAYPYFLILFSGWNYGLNLTKIVELKGFKSSVLNFTYYSESDMPELIEYIKDNLPNGGLIYTYMEKSDYKYLVYEMNKNNLRKPNYYSTTILSNMYNDILNNPEVFESTLIIGTYLPFIQLNENDNFYSYCEIMNIDIKNMSLRNLEIFINIYQIFLFYNFFEEKSGISQNFKAYYSYEFDFPQGISEMKTNNILTKTLYVYEYENGKFKRILGSESTYTQNQYPSEISFYFIL